jgi:acetoin utilization protein AcuB
MIVGKRMSSPLITVSPDTPLPEAISLMQREKIRHLIVVEKNKMVGLVARNNLQNAYPTKATSLSVWEINYLIEKIKVADIMVRDVITVTEDTPIEEAARVMADNKISSLPVMKDGEVVGIITEIDLFKIFLELLGARQKGVRVSVEISDVPGSIAKLSKAIYEAGGDIISFGTFSGESLSSDLVTVKIRGVDEKALKSAIEPVVLKLVDIRTV